MDSPDSVAPLNPGQRISTILIVEDETLIRIMLSDYLQECGFAVLEAANADEAVTLIERDVSGIDLIFSDVRMPGTMDGFGLAKWVRENRPSLPVILTSGDIGKANLAQDLCANGLFLAKPYELDLIAEKIRQAIEERPT
jgi:DNA-binding NtrC family response regulator